MSTDPFATPPWLLTPGPLGPFDPFVNLNDYGFAVPQGSPHAIASAATSLTQLASVLDDQARNITGGAQTATSEWQGSAASSFASYAGHVVKACSANATACSSAATALTSLSDELAHAQKVTREAQADCQQAEGQVTRHQSAAQAAGQASRTAATQALLSPHPSVAADYQRQSQQAQQEQADAQTAAQAAQGDLDAAQRRGRQAYEAYMHQAQAANTKLAAAAHELRPAPALPGAKTTAKPAPKHHHSIWGVAIPALATVGLTALDVLQLGLDPATDAATVATGAETVSVLSGEVAETAAVADAGAAAAAGEEGVATGWASGDDIWSITRANNSPAWSTVRGRFWKNVANDPARAGQWDEANLARMRKGLAPQRFNPDKGGMESMELSHEPIPARDGGQGLVPRWPQDHAAVDPFRYPGY